MTRRAELEDKPKRKPKGDYEVGYARTPTSTRWQPKQCGNPKGSSAKRRARKAHRSEPSIKEMLLTEALKSVKLRENGAEEEVPVIQAMMRALKMAGLKGSRIAQKDFINLTLMLEEKAAKEVTEYFETVLNYKEYWYKDSLERRAQEGLPPPLPHPDDIHLDRIHGNIIFTGPTNEDEKAWLVRQLALREYLTGEIVLIKEDMRICQEFGAPSDQQQLRLIGYFEKTIERIENAIEERGWEMRLAGASAPQITPGDPDRQTELQAFLGFDFSPKPKPDDGLTWRERAQRRIDAREATEKNSKSRTAKKKKTQNHDFKPSSG